MWRSWNFIAGGRENGLQTVEYGLAVAQKVKPRIIIGLGSSTPQYNPEEWM